MWTAGKAKSKGKGKGGAKGKQPKADDAEGPKAYELPRMRITADKFTGTVVGWRGKYGWIKATEDIEHEKAALRGGKLFAGMADIIGAESLDMGAEVEFHIFEDESGLGAEEIVVTGEGKPVAKPAKAAGKGKAAGGKGGKAVTAPLGVKGKAPAGGKGSKGLAQGWNALTSLVAQVAGATGKGKGFGKAGGKGKDGKGKAKKKEGHLLPRTRISAEKFTGTVTAWKGKFGWISPAEPIEHEKAGLHKGLLFTGINDLQGGIEALKPDAVVEFHISEDSSGLCAEEVEQL